jgi:heme/copper-type cytochrome/quinol oxidase subunit 3
MFAEHWIRHSMGAETVSENGKRYVGVSMLWTVATAILAATFIGVSTLFSWHKETPHDNTLTTGRFDDKMEIVFYRLTRIEAHLPSLNREVSRAHDP